MPAQANARPQLKPATDSYDQMIANHVEVTLLAKYLADENDRRRFVDGMAEVKVKQEEVIMRQGDKGNNFYIIKSGTCDVWIADSTGERTCVRGLAAGSVCGELSLLTGMPRSASIMATSEEVTLLMCNKRTFNEKVGNRIAEKRKDLKPFLSELSIFAEMRDNKPRAYEMGMLIDATVPIEFPAGKAICEKGQPSDNKFYIVREGEVHSSGLTPTVYRKHDFFGQVELLQSSKNQESRKAGPAGAKTVSIPKGDFMTLVPLNEFLSNVSQQAFALQNDKGGKQMRGRRFGESAETTTATGGRGGSIALPKNPKKSPEAIERIKKAVKDQIIFSRLTELQLGMLQGAMTEHAVPAGSNVITQGEKGNHFFIVDSGELNVFITADEPGAQPQRVKSFGPGDSFGELALMYNCPRTATITAATDAVLWSLDRVSFRMIVLEANTKKASMYESFLEKVTLLAPLSKEQRNRMVDALEEVAVSAKESIINEGDEGTHFYIIVEGEVSITKSGTDGELARRKTGDYFGELSLRTGAPTIASVHAATPCKLVRMDRGAFQRLLGPLDSNLAMRKYTDSGTEAAARPEGEGGGGGDGKS